MSKHHSTLKFVPALRDFGVIHHNLIGELGYIRGYHVQSERRLANHHLDLVEGRPLTPPSDSPESSWHCYDFRSTLHNEATELVGASSRLLRSGILFCTIALLEGWLTEVGFFCAGLTQCRLTPRDLRQEGLRKMVLYLEGVCGVEVSVSDPRFSEIFAFAKIRNIFSHRGGCVGNPNQLAGELVEITSNPAFCSWEGRRIVLQPGFNEGLLAAAERFGEDIADAVIPWIQRPVQKARSQSSKEVVAP